MKEAIRAFRQVSAANEFREIERLRERARHNEASALYHARMEEREKWQAVITQKDEENEKLRKQIFELQAKMKGNDE